MTVTNKLGEEIKYEDKSDYLTWWKYLTFNNNQNKIKSKGE